MSMSYQGRVFQIKHCCFVKCLDRVELPETIVSVPLSFTPFSGIPSVGKGGLSGGMADASVCPGWLECTDSRNTV